MKRLVLASLAFCFVLSACKTEEAVASEVDVRVNVQLLNGGEAIALGDIFLTDEGYRVRFDELNFYLGSFVMDTPEGSFDLLDPVEIFRLEDGLDSFSKQVWFTEMQGLDLLVGVDEDINSDPEPSAYASDHPLSTFANMFWVWNTGYKFVSIEGRIDLTGTEGAELNEFVSIHTGLNENLRSTSFNINRQPECGVMNVQLGIEVSTLFNATTVIDLGESRQTHTTDYPELAADFTDNFIASIVVE